MLAEEQWKPALPDAIDPEEVVAWTRIWAQWDDERASTGPSETYPAYIPELFDRQLRSLSAIFVKFAIRNCAIFAVYYRPFISELWTTCLRLPVPRDQIGLS